MEKYFDIVVNMDDETGFDFNSIVDHPAHELNHIAFNSKAHYHFNDEKRIVTGVAIAADKWIYRNDELYGSHYVRFRPKTIELMNLKNSKFNMFNKLNLQHNAQDIAKGVYLVANYIVSNSDPKYPNVPEAFKDQDVKDGSLIRSYYFENEQLWQRVKKGEFGGFSIEGWFDKKQVNFNKQNKMSNKKKTVWDYLGFTTDEPAKFAQVTAVDGTVMMYDGELAEGTAVFIDENGEQVPAPAGDYQVTLEDGSEKIISISIDEQTGNSVVSSIADVEAMSSDDDEPTVSVEEQVAEVMKKVLADTDERFKALEAENKTLKEQVNAFKSQLESVSKGGKFQAEPKKGGAEPQKKSALDLLNAK
jgi:hypothetical protein